MDRDLFLISAAAVFVIVALFFFLALARAAISFASDIGRDGLPNPALTLVVAILWGLSILATFSMTALVSAFGFPAFALIFAATAGPYLVVGPIIAAASERFRRNSLAGGDLRDDEPPVFRKPASLFSFDGEPVRSETSNPRESANTRLDTE